MRPNRVLPPEEFCLGVRPRKAANSRGPAKLDTSWTLAAIADAVIGPKPGILINRRAVSSRCASLAIVRSSRAIASSRFRSWMTSGASASQTSTGSSRRRSQCDRPVLARVLFSTPIDIVAAVSKPIEVGPIGVDVAEIGLQLNTKPEQVHLRADSAPGFLTWPAHGSLSMKWRRIWIDTNHAELVGSGPIVSKYSREERSGRRPSITWSQATR